MPYQVLSYDHYALAFSKLGLPIRLEYNQQNRDNYLKGNFSKLLHQGSFARHKSASNLNPMLEVSDDSRQ